MKLLENTLFKLNRKVITAALLALLATNANAGLIEVDTNGINFSFEDNETIMKTGDIYIDWADEKNDTNQAVGRFTMIEDDDEPLWWYRKDGKELNYIVNYDYSYIDLNIYVSDFGTLVKTEGYEDDSTVIKENGVLFLSLKGKSGSKENGWFLNVNGGAAQDYFADPESDKDMFFSYSLGKSATNYDNRGSANLSTVPEPTSLALLGLGLIGIGFAHKKRSS